MLDLGRGAVIGAPTMIAVAIYCGHAELTPFESGYAMGQALLPAFCTGIFALFGRTSPAWSRLLVFYLAVFAVGFLGRAGQLGRSPG
jgi:hypothetical protein